MALIAAALLRLVLQVGSGAAADSTAAAIQPSAFLDDGAAQMVRLARGRVRSTSELIESYRVIAREHESVRLRGFGRDRLAYRQDRAARIEWERGGPARMELLGSRELTPLVTAEAGVSSDGELASGARDLVFEPDQEWLLRAPGSGDEENSRSFIHPLGPASEEHYRFRSGSPTTIRFPDGPEVRLVELQVIPRRSDHRLVSGSLWLTSDDFTPVRGVFRYSVPVAIGIYTEDRAWGAAGEFRLFMVEYGLWQGRWWLPRLFTYEGSATVGSMTATVRKEITYEGYQVFPADTGVARPESEAPWNLAVDGAAFDVLTDSAESCDPERSSATGVCREYLVWVPRDRSTLTTSSELPPTFGAGAGLLSEAEIRRGVEALYSSGAAWDLVSAPSVEWKWLDPSLVHFNRVEGATIGSSTAVELADLRLTGAGWLGLADRALNFEAAVTRDRYSGSETGAVYRRMESFSPQDRPFQIGNSLSSLVLGRDQGDYYRVLGVDLGWTPVAEASSSHSWRLYAERQTAVETNTNISLHRALGGGGSRFNPAADAADQVGLAGTLRFAHGLDPARWRGSVQVDGVAEAGTYSFLRPRAQASLGMPLPGPLLGALEVAGGTALGELPVQRRWYLGGPSTIRGIDPGSRLGGDTFWRGRAEIASAGPAVRLVGFSDLGWVGPGRDLSIDPRLVSVGVGASFLDGLLRADLARPLRGGSGWRLELYWGGPL